MTSILERLLEHLAVAKKAEGPDQLLNLADLGQAVRRLKEELGEIHARAVRGAKISRAEEALELQLYRVVRELEMSQAKELEGVRHAEASKIKPVYVPRIGETD